MFKKVFRQSVVLGVIALPLSLALSCGTPFKPNEEDDQKYFFDGKEFSSSFDLKSYLKENNINSSYEAKNGDYSSLRWKIEGYDQIFTSIDDLNAYVEEHFISETQAKIILDGPMAEALNSEIAGVSFKSIPTNAVIPLATNDDGTLVNPDEGMAYIYKGEDGKIFFTTKKSQQKIMEENAKRSWVRIASAFEFNGIYFSNLSDLEFYLSETFQAEALNKDSFEELKNYQLVMDNNNGNQDTKIAYTIYSERQDDGFRIADEEQIESIVNNAVRNNSELTLRIQTSSTEKDNGKEYIYLTLDNLADNLGWETNNLKANLKYWNLGTQDGNSFYVVDNKKDTRGSLFGPYFVNSPEDLGGVDSNGFNPEGIMNTSSWNEMNATTAQNYLEENFDINGEIVGSLISSTFSQIRSQTEDENSELATNATEEEVSFEELLLYAKQNEIFSQEKYNITIKDNDFIGYLNNVRGSNNIYTKLGNQVKEMSNNLTQGKRYNAFYLLPILRNFTISRLINAQVSQEILENVNNVFIALTDLISAEVNQVLSPVFLDWSEINARENTNLHNGLDLTSIYAFDNFSSSLYNDPRTKLNNVFNGQEGLQGAISKSEVYLWSSIISYANQQVMDAYMAMNEVKYDIPLLSMNDTKYFKMENIIDKSISSFDKIDDSFVSKTLIKARYTELINEFKASINQEFEPVNEDIRKFNNLPNNAKFLLKTSLENPGSASIQTTPGEVLKEVTEMFFKISKKIVLINFYKFVFAYKITGMLKENVYYKNIVDIIGKGKALVATYEAAMKTSQELTKWTNDKIEEINKIFGKLSEKFKVLKKIPKVFEKFMKAIPWLNLAFSVFELVSSIINFFKAQYEPVYYHKALPNGEELIWNGGEKKTQYWKTSVTHNTNDLKLINPIQITVPHTNVNTTSGGDASNFYFNGNFYDTPEFAYIDALKTIMRYKNSDKLFHIINSLFKNVELVYSYDFAIPGKAKNAYWYDEILYPEGLNTEGLVENKLFMSLDEVTNTIIYGDQDAVYVGDNRPILQKVNDKYYLDKESKYLKPIWTTSDGYTENTSQAIDDYIKKILSEIEKIYIFQLPTIESDGTLRKEDYQLPYPYFSLASNSIEKLGQIDPFANKRIIYNPNQKQTSEDGDDSSSQIDNNQIIETIMTNQVFNAFSVESKKVTWDNTIKNKSFDEISEATLQQKVYKARMITGEVKYFWSKSGALAWLNLPKNLDARAINNDEVTRIYHYVGPKQELSFEQEFASIEALFNWLIANNIIEKKVT